MTDLSRIDLDSDRTVHIETKNSVISEVADSHSCSALQINMSDLRRTVIVSNINGLADLRTYQTCKGKTLNGRPVIRHRIGCKTWMQRNRSMRLYLGL